MGLFFRGLGLGVRAVCVAASGVLSSAVVTSETGWVVHCKPKSNERQFTAEMRKTMPLKLSGLSGSEAGEVINREFSQLCLSDQQLLGVESMPWRADNHLVYSIIVNEKLADKLGLPDFDTWKLFVLSQLSVQEDPLEDQLDPDDVNLLTEAINQSRDAEWVQHGGWSYFTYHFMSHREDLH